MKKTYLLFTVFAILSLHSAFGQDKVATDTTKKTSKTEAMVPVVTKTRNYKLDSLTIDSIRGLGSLYNGENTKYDLDEFMIIKMKENIDSLVSLNKKTPIMLWFNGVPFNNLTIWKTNTGNKWLIFKLEMDTSSHSSWNTLFGYAYRSWIHPSKKVTVGIGTINKCLSLPFKDHDVIIDIREGWMMVVGYGIIACIVLLFWWLIKYKHILQDGVSFDDSVSLVDKFSSDANIKVNEVLRKDIPYSLSRTQLCFWIFIVSCSIVFIWLNMDILAVVTTSTAYLIGISGGTSVITKIIEASNKNKVAVKVTAQQFYAKYKTEWFFPDILTDEKGYSISRVQMVIFSAIIGCYFCWHVVYYLQMPTLSDGLLILMGISSSTYAGVKYNETQP
jgi:hypothetical protein